MPFGGKTSCLRRIEMEVEVEVGSSLLGNDKINVIADEALTYFQCLRSKFDVYVARFENK